MPPFFIRSYHSFLFYTIPEPTVSWARSPFGKFNKLFRLRLAVFLTEVKALCVLLSPLFSSGFFPSWVRLWGRRLPTANKIHSPQCGSKIIFQTSGFGRNNIIPLKYFAQISKILLVFLCYQRNSALFFADSFNFQQIVLPGSDS